MLFTFWLCTYLYRITCLNLSCAFLSSERHGLREPKKTEQTQMKIINSLRDHITYSMSDSQHKSYYFSRLLGKLTELRSLSVQGLQRIFYLKLEDLVTAPPLIENMFVASLPFWKKKHMLHNIIESNTIFLKSGNPLIRYIYLILLYLYVHYCYLHQYSNIIQHVL